MFYYAYYDFIILFFYNEYSYLLPVLHVYACMYMGFVPENILIRIRIRILQL